MDMDDVQAATDTLIRSRTASEKRPIVYCRSCLIPETKPDIFFDENGLCSACRHFSDRDDVDWGARRRELDEVLDRYRSKDSATYDCIIGVSGGKDSTTQAIRMLELGMNPLCVTATTDELSDIGRRNIENLKGLGVDFIEYTTNPVARRKMNKLALVQVGDISWPEHVSIFTLPVRLAVQFGIKLIVWGENPQNEYGGPAAAATGNTLTRRWLEEFGGLLGLRVSDLVGQDGIEAKHLIPFTYPSDDDLQRVGVTGIFLGYYLPWDGLQNAIFAQSYGMETWPGMIEGSLCNYENLDNHQMGIHDYFKFLKFGFGRATDIACLHIRRGRITRRDGLDMVRRHDGKFPWVYLGKTLENILRPLDLTVGEFERICDRFTNKKLFLRDAHGTLVRDKDNNLSKINYDNVASA